MYSANSVEFNKDQAYAYDGLDRLKSYDGGTLSGTTITGTAVAGIDRGSISVALSVSSWAFDHALSWILPQKKRNLVRYVSKDRKPRAV